MGVGGDADLGFICPGSSFQCADSPKSLVSHCLDPPHSFLPPCPELKALRGVCPGSASKKGAGGWWWNGEVGGWACPLKYPGGMHRINPSSIPGGPLSKNREGLKRPHGPTV